MTKTDDEALADLARHLRARRTINLFTADPAPTDLLRQALEVARWAPNHHVTEPWRFYLPGPRTTALAIDYMVAGAVDAGGEEAGAARRRRLAAVPGWFVVTSLLSPDNTLREREDYAATCCAIQNLQLFLWQAGIGVKWTTGAPTREAAFHRLFGIDPEQERMAGLFWYGYPKRVPEQKRRPVKEIATDLP